MQNEFEKQVQQKMEELNLVPSEPVWQKVELQIRRKKDRRRLFFWLPLAVLLVGGGLWYAMSESSKTSSSENTRSQTEKQTTDTPLVPVTEATEKNNQSTTLEKENDPQAETIKEPVHETNPVNKVFTPGQKKNFSSDNSISGRNNPEKKDLRIVNEKVPEQTQERVAINSNPQRAAVKAVDINNADTTSEIIHNNDRTIPKGKEIVVTNKKLEEILKERVGQHNIYTSEFRTAIAERNDTITASIIESRKINTIQEKGSVEQDSNSFRKAAVKKPAISKWKYSVALSSGWSGAGRIGFFNGQKSLAYASPNAPAAGGGTRWYDSSAVKKGLSFSIGGVAQRKLGNRTSFSTGLLYHYYSNTIMVGNRVVQNTVLRDYAVSQYYSNIGPNNIFVPLQPFDNRYHFLSVPVSFDWQVLKKLPLNFQTELSLQYLMHTNGLVFDDNRQAYFHSKKAFNRLQLFSGFGLNYSLPFKTNTISLGPQVQYGLSRLEKDNSNYHLFSYGLKAQLQFNRK